VIDVTKNIGCLKMTAVYIAIFLENEFLWGGSK